VIAADALATVALGRDVLMAPPSDSLIDSASTVARPQTVVIDRRQFTHSAAGDPPQRRL